MEPRVKQNETRSVVGSLKVDECLRRGGGEVEPLLVDINRRRGWEHIESPDGSRTGRPAITKDRLVVTIEHTHLRRARENGKFGGCLVESLFDIVAMA